MQLNILLITKQATRGSVPCSRMPTVGLRTSGIEPRNVQLGDEHDLRYQYHCSYHARRAPPIPALVVVPPHRAAAVGDEGRGDGQRAVGGEVGHAAGGQGPPGLCLGTAWWGDGNRDNQSALFSRMFYILRYHVNSRNKKTY